MFEARMETSGRRLDVGPNMKLTRSAEANGPVPFCSLCSTNGQMGECQLFGWPELRWVPVLLSSRLCFFFLAQAYSTTPSSVWAWKRGGRNLRHLQWRNAIAISSEDRYQDYSSVLNLLPRLKCDRSFATPCYMLAPNYSHSTRHLRGVSAVVQPQIVQGHLRTKKGCPILKQ